jgi:hypothetical protein
MSQSTSIPRHAWNHQQTELIPIGMEESRKKKKTSGKHKDWYREENNEGV